jgi:hypothetical protein
MFAHWSPIRFHTAEDVQQRCDDPQVAGDRRLAREQRQHALVNLQVPPVDPVIIGDHHPGQLDIPVADRLERPVGLIDHHLETPERLALELLQRFVEPVAGLFHLCRPTLPVTSRSTRSSLRSVSTRVVGPRSTNSPPNMNAVAVAARDARCGLWLTITIA